MKKAALLLVLLFVANCAHRVTQPTATPSPALIFVQPNASAPPPVTTEPPSPLPVEAPAVVPPEQHEAAGRFLQRVAYHTRVRESMTSTPVPPVERAVVQPQFVPPEAPQSLPSPRLPSKPSRHETISVLSLVVCCAVVLFGIVFERAKLT